MGYAVQGTVYETAIFVSVRLGEMNGGVVVFNGIKHEKDFAGVAVVQPLLPAYCQGKKYGEEDSPEQRGVKAMQCRSFKKIQSPHCSCS